MRSRYFDSLHDGSSSCTESVLEAAMLCDALYFGSYRGVMEYFVPLP